MKAYLLLSFIFILCSCADDADIECLPITDGISIIDQKVHGGVTYYLVLRVVGYQDKTEVIEVYDQKPVFTNCTNQTIEPILSDATDPAYTKSFSIDLDNKKFLIEYAGSPTGQDSKSVYRLNFKE